jgi:hypothetical protein
LDGLKKREVDRAQSAKAREIGGWQRSGLGPLDPYGMAGSLQGGADGGF